MNVSRCDVTLYEEFKNKARTMPHDELYYALLDWADQHQEVKEEYIKSIDTYEVRYIHKNGEHISKLFKTPCARNPPLIEVGMNCDKHGVYLTFTSHSIII